ncbi:hypothetical protein [Lactococcus lactis]|uniref:hypothetical protein n=1 Tax=Lactococcus lactis TaxID=1358 RepID=UPI0022E620FF|nr:hypothetical protein [Lactococcus lactis]
MDIEVDTFEQVDSFMKQQQKKIDSWLPFDNMLIPTGIMEQQEQKKVNMLRMIFKTLQQNQYFDIVLNENYAEIS